jgi:hypothetical protein
VTHFLQVVLLWAYGNCSNPAGRRKKSVVSATRDWRKRDWLEKALSGSIRETALPHPDG